jgi:hypothetical protein
LPVFFENIYLVSEEDFPSWSPITTTSDEGWFVCFFENIYFCFRRIVSFNYAADHNSIVPVSSYNSSKLVSIALYNTYLVADLYNQRNRTKSPFAESGVELTSLFCFGREDAFYRHPADCSGIVQCFGNYLFVYSSCGSGLVFNEATSKCDYSYNVRECSNEPSRTGNYAENAEQEAGGQGLHRVLLPSLIVVYF